MVNQILSGVKQVKGFNDDGTSKELEFEDGILYCVRTNKDSNDEGYLYLNGKKYGLHNKIDCGEY